MIVQTLPDGFWLLTSVLNITPNGTYFMKISVDVLPVNTFTKLVTIPSKYNLCKLKRADVISSKTTNSDAQMAYDFLNLFAYPENAEQAKALKDLLLRWKDVYCQIQ